MFRRGDRIGSYILIERIGKGAFGVVWLAEEHTALSTHKVALKLPNEEDIDLEAVKQEAKVWESIKGHPNILPIIKADIVDGQLYIASEYVPDGSLQAWLNKYGGRAPSIEAAVEMTCGILAGLEHLHSKNVIHRDLKPANILLQSNTPRLADFGLARVLKTTSQSSKVSGTYAYMPPEAFDGRRSKQTDIWSVGVILFQLLTGRLPFPQPDTSSLIAAILMNEPEPLPESFPKWLRQAIEKALRKDPSQRWQSAAEMRLALIKQIAQEEETIDDSETISNDEKSLLETIDAEIFPKNKPKQDLALKKENNAEINNEGQKFKVDLNDVFLKKEKLEEAKKEISDDPFKEVNKESKVKSNQNKNSILGFVGIMIVIGAITVFFRLFPPPTQIANIDTNNGTNVEKSPSDKDVTPVNSPSSTPGRYPYPPVSSSPIPSTTPSLSSVDKTGKFPAQIASFNLKESGTTDIYIFTKNDYQGVYERDSKSVILVIFNADSNKAQTLFDGSVTRYKTQPSHYKIIKHEENSKYKIVIVHSPFGQFSADILKNNQLYRIYSSNDLSVLIEFIEAFNQQF